MTNRLDLFRCNVCGNLVQVMLAGEGELVCCGEPMELLQPKGITSEMEEKHVPVFVKNECGNFVVHVGSIPHPMTDEHYIMFIQVVSKNNDKICTKFLSPNDVPKMLLGHDFNEFFAREYCNIHGLWEGIND
ncbi:MAG: desulfoferrodoxin FeS4 iron-binding domain-containing protein [Cyanobacteria bacterium SIG32]|nr:desulfoferrodoxin FeS4 iron-binding domain-containing protein [Cyanobacteria bacterium SIG32]